MQLGWLAGCWPARFESGPVGCKAIQKQKKQGWVSWMLSCGVKKTGPLLTALGPAKTYGLASITKLLSGIADNSGLLVPSGQRIKIGALEVQPRCA